MRTTTLASDFRFDQIATEIEKQFLDSVLFASLRFVVHRPILLIRRLLCDRHRLRFGYGTIRVDFPTRCEFDREQMFALLARFNVVGARTHSIDWIDTVRLFNSALTRHPPRLTVSLNLARFGDS